MAQTEQAWLDQARAGALRGDFSGVHALLVNALTEHPHSFELRRVLAGAQQQTGKVEHAEATLHDLLRERPQDFATAFTLAALLIKQARGHAAAQALGNCFEHGQRDPELAIQAIELLDEADRKADAAAIADIAVTVTPDDARLHAYAGMLQLQLGNFDQARKHYLCAVERSPLACEWHAPLGLANAQRYAHPEHSDFNMFNTLLEHKDLSDKARSTLLFALGKAHDDVGDYAQAAMNFRQANALAHSLSQWSRKQWRRTVEARLATPPIAQRASAAEDFVPIFIVGMPRSGTTLLAELLARHLHVCNRGELPWIAKLAEQPGLAVNPDRVALERGAAIYTSQTRQDDAVDARWFIDKQPLNFRYVGLMLALFPNAKLIHCQRCPRDTVLSVWMQSFIEDVQGYAYDFDNIALVMRDCERLMTCWRGRYPDSIRSVGYETLVTAPKDVIASLAEWIGLLLPPSEEARAGMKSAISTASLWQARQPIHSGSVGRWKNYATYIPELLTLPET